MLKRLVRSFLAGLFVFLLLDIGGREWMDRFFWESNFLGESKILEELQIHVEKHHIKATDAISLKKWAYDNRIIEFVVVREGRLLFNLKIQEGIVEDGIQLLTNWEKGYTNVIEFADGNANVQLYDGRNERCHDILLGISLFTGLVLGLTVLMSGIREDVDYICYLEREVEKIGQGNLSANIMVEGQDELAKLAQGLDIMRKMLVYREEKEHEMRVAQDKLVLGMAHDLRTPLTGLMTYIEILRKQENEGKVSREYIDKAFDKIFQIRALSDQMFEYFFVFSKEKIDLESAEEVESAFGDYMSELLALLDYVGFSVNAKKIVWRPILVQINRNYMGRIINNLVSNIRKYGDMKQEVCLEFFYLSDKVGISITNGIALSDSHINGTGIGLKNVSHMMYQMNGCVEIPEMEKVFRVILWFPVIKDFDLM